MYSDDHIKKITDEIIEGRRLTAEDDTGFLKECRLSLLSSCADKIRAHFSGNRVELCSIISGKGGNCGEDCKFCAQSAHYKTKCEVFDFLTYEEVVNEARHHESKGVDRFAIVTAGRTPSDEDFEKIVEYFSKMKGELKISLCASLGFLSAEQFARLKAAGVSRYHNNIETSRRYFGEICSTHSFDEKIENIKRAKAAGLTVCSGGIIGMGEMMDDRIDMAFTLSEIGVISIPINVLLPIKNTPLEGLTPLSKEEILRTVAIFRFINPEAGIRLAAGRKLLGDLGKSAFLGGASAAITGDMLTTTGSTTDSDLEMLREMGRR